METQEKALTSVVSNSLTTHPKDVWTMRVDDETYELTGNQVKALKQAMDAGNRGCRRQPHAGILELCSAGIRDGRDHADDGSTHGSGGIV